MLRHFFQDLNQAKVEERKQPSASPDEATVYVTVKWPRKDLPPKWESTLEKTLQSWLNKDFGDKTTDCTLKGLYCNGSWAEVKITPSTGENDGVKNVKFITKIPSTHFKC